MLVVTRPVLVYFSDVWLLELVKHATENKDIGSWDMSLKWRKWTKRSMNVTDVTMNYHDIYVVIVAFQVDLTQNCVTRVFYKHTALAITPILASGAL